MPRCCSALALCPSFLSCGASCPCRAVFLLALERCLSCALALELLILFVVKLLCYCRVLTADLLYVGSSTAQAVPVCECAWVVRCDGRVLAMHLPCAFQQVLSTVRFECALDGPVAFELLRESPQSKYPWRCKAKP
jgi:hypothetical protein